MPKAITIRRVDGSPGQVYYPLEYVEVPEQRLEERQVAVRIQAVALNHRDLFIRQHLYPGTTFGVPLLSDGCGMVVEAGSSKEAQEFKGKRVVINPASGWKEDPSGPEAAGGCAILGGTKQNPIGTLCEVVVIDIAELEIAPSHLIDTEAAALPLTGLTAWRALVTKSGNACPGHNILVTGIGGGVALMTLIFAQALGVNVYVSSSNKGKAQRAKEMGAAGTVDYTEEGWEKHLLSQLPEGRKYLDAIIDGAGGEIVTKGVKMLKQGGTVVVYGMTTGPKMPFTMNAVLHNVEVRGTTMGSRKEFANMVHFVEEKRLKPIISRVVRGFDDLAAIDGLFEDMKSAKQFGKLVISLAKDTAETKL